MVNLFIMILSIILTSMGLVWSFSVITLFDTTTSLVIGLLVFACVQMITFKMVCQ